MPMCSSKLAELWHTHAAMLRLYAKVHCVMADDCVQEAFVRLATVEPEPNDAKAWLIRVVRNLAIDYAKLSSRRERREREVARLESQWFEGSSRAGEAISSTEIEIALRSLTVESREIVVAHLWSGLTFRQIAELLDRSVSSVHRQYQEGIEQLRDQLLAEQGKLSRENLGDEELK